MVSQELMVRQVGTEMKEPHERMVSQGKMVSQERTGRQDCQARKARKARKETGDSEDLEALVVEAVAVVALLPKP